MRQLTQAEWTLVVRLICDAQHILAVRHGGTFVEAGTTLDEADATTSCLIDDRGLIDGLDLALKALGFKPGEDPFPPPLRDQLALALQLPPR